MKWFAAAVLFSSCSCLVSSPLIKEAPKEPEKAAVMKNTLRVKLSPDVALDRDQVLICVYIHEQSITVCMGPEEYAARLNAMPDEHGE